ncbi:MAG TPA: hypothetical protein VKT32_12315 [Chthonomonadaceae bacterium]|nr:hypothetical protein [Chthonomonadaceae bacterium]
MPGKTPQQEDHALCAVDMNALRADLDSPDAATRARAVRSICPCRMGWQHFEEIIGLLERMKKDPDPMVRANALHVFQDAAEMESSRPPTHPQIMTNEMAATRFRMRGVFGDEAQSREEKARRKAQDRERRTPRRP